MSNLLNTVSRVDLILVKCLLQKKNLEKKVNRVP